MEIEEIGSRVLEKVKPTEEKKKRVREISEEILEEVRSNLKMENEPEIVGSVSKDTYINDPDIDVFVKFPLSTSRDSMERKIIETGRTILESSKERYAEHPYIYGHYKGFEVDIVPCYEMEDISKMKSAVDRTPFHTEYIKENLREEQKDEARLLKAYLEGIGAYGAKAEVWGFSGYLCELLILQYGSFKKTIENVSGWKPGQTIEIEETDKDFDDPLVVIDPIDPDRNVASPVSKEKFSLFVLSSKLFLDDPNLKFFFPDEVRTLEKEKLSKMIEERGTSLLGLKFPKPDVVEDNLYPQIQKCLRRLVHHLSHRDFEPLHSGYFVKDDRLLLIFEFKSDILPDVEKHRGPPVWVEHTQDFIKKYREDVYLEEDRLWVDRDRKYTSVKESIMNIMEEIGLGSDLNKFLPEKVTFLDQEKILKSEKKALTEFYDRRFPWER